MDSYLSYLATKYDFDALSGNTSERAVNLITTDTCGSQKMLTSLVEGYLLHMIHQTESRSNLQNAETAIVISDTGVYF